MNEIEMRELLDKVSNVIEKENALEKIKNSIKEDAKSQMRIMEKYIRSDDGINEDEKKILISKLNIEAIQFDLDF